MLSQKEAREITARLRREIADIEHYLAGVKANLVRMQELCPHQTIQKTLLIDSKETEEGDICLDCGAVVKKPKAPLHSLGLVRVDV